MQHTGFLSIIVKLIGYLLLAGYLYGCGLVVRPKVAFVVKNKNYFAGSKTVLQYKSSLASGEVEIDFQPIYIYLPKKYPWPPTMAFVLISGFTFWIVKLLKR